MTLLELKTKIDELIAKGYKYEHLDVHISAIADNPPMNHIFVKVTDITVGDPGGWGNLLACLDTEQEVELLEENK